MATPAPACRKAIQDANLRWPSRSRASDGIMGDARHQKSKSDHNMGNAFDLTHDPASGCIGGVIAAAAIRDPRVKYVIWNRQIFNRQRGDTHFRPYRGQNPHTHHCHVSVLAGSRGDTRPWQWAPGGQVLAAAVDTPAGDHPVAKRTRTPASTAGRGAALPADRRAFPGVLLKNGMRGELVTLVQERLKRLRWDVHVDGLFGEETERIVRAFQKRRALEVDGTVGRRTWSALFG